MHDLVATILGVVGLLAISSVLRPVATRINFPFTVLLALVGVVLGAIVVAFGHTDVWLLGDFMRSMSALEITSDAVFFLFLPTLVFEAALSINVRRLLDDLLPILVLAVVGLLISTSLIGGALWWASGVSLAARDFRNFLDRNPELRETIHSIARERIGQDMQFSPAGTV